MIRSIVYGGTIGQTVLLVSCALLGAQVIGFFLLVNERDRWQILDAVQPAIEQFVASAKEMESAPHAHPDVFELRASGPERRIMVSPWSAIEFLGLKRQADLEGRLSTALRRAGVRIRKAQASSSGFSNSPPGNARLQPFRIGFGTSGPFGPGIFVRAAKADGRAPLVLPPGGVAVQAFGGGEAEAPKLSAAPPSPAHDQKFAFMPGSPERAGMIVSTAGPGGLLPVPPLPELKLPRERDVLFQHLDFSAQLADGSWLNGQFAYHRPSTSFLSRLALAELILFGLVVTATVLLSVRFARPLLQLATAADRIGPSQPPPTVPARGPSDVRAAIRSFNAMTMRVSDLLKEKDRMLGAIGHDLKTPLAALRVRAEAIEPLAERNKIIEMIDDMTNTVCEILDLALLGHVTEQPVPVDITALAEAVVEEFREMERDATFHDSPRAVLTVQPLLTKRLLRNLIENAIKFGGRAYVGIERNDAEVCLTVADDGPGIPEELREQVFEPFIRLEASRNRDTGGSGLGLSIAREIARIQKASLLLGDGPSGGLLVRVIWPARHRES